jgi:hypothetical protein
MLSTLADRLERGVPTSLRCDRGRKGPQPTCRARRQWRDCGMVSSRPQRDPGRRPDLRPWHVDGKLDYADPPQAIAGSISQVLRLRSQPVVALPPDGPVCQPDPMAISQVRPPPRSAPSMLHISLPWPATSNGPSPLHGRLHRSPGDVRGRRQRPEHGGRPGRPARRVLVASGRSACACPQHPTGQRRCAHWPVTEAIFSALGPSRRFPKLSFTVGCPAGGSLALARSCMRVASRSWIYSQESPDGQPCASFMRVRRGGRRVIG